MREKILIFLAGKGKEIQEYEGLPEDLAKRFDAELVNVVAPYPHPKPEKAAKGKRTWFNKTVNEREQGREDAVEEDYFHSLDIIKNQINELTNHGVNPKDIIIFGHSMGAGLAVHAGLEMELGGVIAVAADVPYNLNYDSGATQTPIYWFECRNDTVLKDPRRKLSYHLVDNHPNFHYNILPNSTHDDFGKDLLTAVNKNIIRETGGTYLLASQNRGR